MTQAQQRYAFQHQGLDRADELRDDNETLARLWRDANVLVIDIEGQARGFGDPEALRSIFGHLDTFASSFAIVEP